MHTVLFLDRPSDHVVKIVKEITQAAFEENVKQIAVVHPNPEEKNNGKPKKSIYSFIHYNPVRNVMFDYK